MRIAELLLPEWDQEIATTRRVVERVPDGKGTWKPHEKSFPLAHLAQLCARLPAWAGLVMDATEFDIAPPGGSQYPPYSIETTAVLLAELDRNAAAGRASIAKASDADFDVPWTFKRAGQAMFTEPRYMVLRGMTINHIVHHRAQLGLYLRMLGEKVPSMYGPTADDHG